MHGLATGTGSAVSAIRRIGADRVRWRVKVASWAAAEGFRGRFIFEPEGAFAAAPRAGPAALSAQTREELVRTAHAPSEVQLRALCRSLG